MAYKMSQEFLTVSLDITNKLWMKWKNLVFVNSAEGPEVGFQK